MQRPSPTHHSATSLWLRGGTVRKTEGPDVRSAQTIDQHIVDAIGPGTALPSLSSNLARRRNDSDR
jgi:hypothetical protein